jgi:polyhydroxybutyrate depolymerase
MRHKASLRWAWYRSVALALCATTLPRPGWCEDSAEPTGPITLKVNVDGLERKARIYPGAQAKESPSPLLLAFHGYSGTAANYDKATQLQKAWPQATVVYVQGLVIPERNDGRIANGKRRNGWQRRVGMDGDRDLRCVDTLIEVLSEQYEVDRSRIFATGFSNGAVFTWVLMKARPETFAGFAPIAGIDHGTIEDATVPCPVIFHFGKNDKAFKLVWALKSLRRAKKVNKCTTREQHEWRPGYVWFEHEPGGAPVVWHLHDGGHEAPRYSSKHIVEFFQECVDTRGNGA